MSKVASILALVGLVAGTASAELSTEGFGRTFFHPFGQCQVVPGDQTIPRHHVICTSDYPDVTGDGQPEQLVVFLEIGQKDVLKCGTYWLRDLSCPSDRLCNRLMQWNRECF